MTQLTKKQADNIVETLLERLAEPLADRLLDYRDVVINQWTDDEGGDDASVIGYGCEPELTEIMSQHEIYADEILAEVRDLLRDILFSPDETVDPLDE